MTPFYREGSSLWIAAIFLALLGGVVTYIIGLDTTDTARQAHMAMSAMVTVIVVGVLAICASAHWWVHR